MGEHGPAGVQEPDKWEMGPTGAIGSTVPAGVPGPVGHTGDD